MKKYEWDFETLEDGDIVDHHFGNTIKELGNKDSNQFLVLVLDVTIDGHMTRLWAYADSNNNLPEFFEDAFGEYTKHKVPQRFHK